ncbi:uncharacterized protein LOC124945314 [Impatiens glandulifera]|uniref:uncharacterized protein LOC124945314 n=1 Tax=Impatiens glandulifera TaxID=253017 RepID=UPI001FB0A77F|nr:uncharacterized protein LOC124945314 [Impatiens glandulifera]
MDATPTTKWARTQWRMRLGSALRTSAACAVVGCATMYGPEPIRAQLAFPAFSYLTTILIVCDATLGDALRGCWHVILATVFVIPACVLGLWVLGRGWCSIWPVAALVVAVGGFLVALSGKNTSLLAKRIGFGQVVIVVVGAVVLGEKDGVLEHPFHVAASTALGGLASVLAMLLPYPRLAYSEVGKLLRLYGENTKERTAIFLKAFLAPNATTAAQYISLSPPFAETGAKLLHNIKNLQGGLLWEKPWIKKHSKSLEDRLQDIELPIRGLEIALSSGFFPLDHQELAESLPRIETQISLKLDQTISFNASPTTTVPELQEDFLNKSLNCLKPNDLTPKNLPSLFFLFCLTLLIQPSIITRKPKTRKPDNFWPCLSCPSKETLLFAVKCSMSLGLAVLFGLTFDKENAFWAGLTIAISFSNERQATFTVANARAQGTAMGSVYGVLGCFFFRRFSQVKFLALLPWIVFTCFLRYSRMYGQPGAISSVIGALLILGRKNYGNPKEFAIERLTEAFIGLFCLVLVENLLQPARAISLAKFELSNSLRALNECIEEIVDSNLRDKKQEILKTHIKKLEKFCGEAELEPNFWFFPFKGKCFWKLHKSLSKMCDVLHFMGFELELDDDQEELDHLQQYMKIDLEQFKDDIAISLKRLESITSIKSSAVHEEESKQKGTNHDLETGRSKSGSNGLFLQQMKEVTDKMQDGQKKGMILRLGAMGFCVNLLMREMEEIERAVLELVQWENPSGLQNIL